MARDVQRSERDAALRAVLVQRAKDSRSRDRNTITRRRVTTTSRLPTVATLLVLVFVIALSAAAIAAGQSRTSAASEDLAAPAPTGSEHLRLSPSPPPRSTDSGQLIAMDGARALTRAQLHAWILANSDGSAGAAIGEQQEWLKVQCMAVHGYLYDPTFDGSQGLELGKRWGLTPKQLKGYRTTLWGLSLNSSKPYDWRTAGCDGQAVHLTGQDDNH